MRKFMILIAMILLISSIILMFSFLFNQQPIQIVLETGQEVTTQNPGYFTMTTVLILIVCSFIIGSASAYLFYNADNIFSTFKPEKTKERHDADFKIVLPLLRHDERKVVHALMDNNGEMLQNALVLKLGLSKVKMTRLLLALHNKQIIEKERHGLTNKIKLKARN
jgi:hypothetical protein